MNLDYIYIYSTNKKDIEKLKTDFKKVKNNDIKDFLKKIFSKKEYQHIVFKNQLDQIVDSNGVNLKTLLKNENQKIYEYYIKNKEPSIVKLCDQFGEDYVDELIYGHYLSNHSGTFFKILDQEKFSSMNEKEHQQIVEIFSKYFFLIISES